MASFSQLIPLILSVLVAVVIIYRLLTGPRYGRSTSKSHKADNSGLKGARALPGRCYQAKSIAIGFNACDAAVSLRGKSFLIDEAPQLPLPNCDRVCHCKYNIHGDRRIKEDRRYPAEELGKLQGIFAKNDLRKGDDRRRGTQPPIKGIY